MSSIIINGTNHQLHAHYYANKKKPDAPIALLFPAHKYYDKKPVPTPSFLEILFQTQRIELAISNGLRAAGFSTFILQYNYPVNPHLQPGTRELTDATFALDWLKSTHKGEVWVGGFFFGSILALQLLMRRPEIKRFICVAPFSVQEDLPFLLPCPCSGFIIQPSTSDLKSREKTKTLCHNLNKQKSAKIHYTLLIGSEETLPSKASIIEKTVYRYTQVSLEAEQSSSPTQ